MKQKLKERKDEKLAQQTCNHYWKIEIANGPKSSGKCKYCGETREFYNAFPEFNPLKKQSDPLKLPELPDVEMDKESES